MGTRVYVAQFENVAISAIQDIFSLKAGTANGITIHWIRLGAIGQTTATEFRLSLKRGTGATVTQGSGGTSPTINAADSSDTKSATATVHANDTTTQLTATTLQTLTSETWNVLLPYEYLPAPEDRDTCNAGEAFALTLNAAPSSTNVSGFIKWEEVP